MERTRFETTCPGCGRMLAGATEDARRARVLTHIRNCHALTRDLSALKILPQPETPAEPAK